MLYEAVSDIPKKYNVKSIKNSFDAVKAFDFIRNQKKEHFVMLTLSTSSEVISVKIVSIGTLNTSLVHPREVFRDAIIDNANAIIIAHNHPSGTLEASDQDISITNRLKECGKLLGIQLLDHIIITENGHLSLSDEGYL